LRLPRFAYLPFGAGPRICIGNGFAMTEAMLILATLARRFRPTLRAGHTIAPFPTITLRPAEPMWMTLLERPQHRTRHDVSAGAAESGAGQAF
jgi:cytochrome P450